MRPLKEFGAPVLDLCMPRPFLTHQSMFDASFPRGWWYYFRSCDVAELNDDIIDIMAEYGSQIASPITSVGIWQMGGAVARVGEDDTAFNGRMAGHTFNIGGNAVSADGFEEERHWARAYWSALSPYHTSVYVNFLMEEGEERIRAGVWGEEVRPAEDAQTQIRPGELLPSQPEHPAGITALMPLCTRGGGRQAAAPSTFAR